MTVAVAGLLDEVTRAKPFGAAVTLDEPGLQDVAPTGATLRLDRLVEVEQRGKRDFASPARRHDERDITALDPTLQAGVADTEELGGQGTRDGVAQLLLERGTDGDKVAAFASMPLSTAKARYVVEQLLPTSVCHGYHRTKVADLYVFLATFVPPAVCEFRLSVPDPVLAQLVAAQSVLQERFRLSKWLLDG
jgi:hypothetical protein